MLQSGHELLVTPDRARSINEDSMLNRGSRFVLIGTLKHLALHPGLSSLKRGYGSSGNRRTCSAGYAGYPDPFVQAAD